MFCVVSPSSAFKGVVSCSRKQSEKQNDALRGNNSFRKHSMQQVITVHAVIVCGCSLNQTAVNFVTHVCSKRVKQLYEL